MKIYGTLDKFIYSKDKENPETLMNGKFFLASTFLFILMCAASIPYFIFYMPGEIINNPEVFYFNLILIILFIFFFPIYKRFGGRVLLINILTFFGWLGNITTYNVNGGIFSADCLWGIIISSWVFLVANKASGYFWMIVTLLTYVIFYYAEVNGYKDFLTDASKLKSGYYFTNYFLGGIFMLLIISLYESSKQKFVNELRDTKTEIESKIRSLRHKK